MAAVHSDEIPVQTLFDKVEHRFAINRQSGSPDCQMGLVTIKPGGGIAPHVHPVSDAMYVVSGEGVLTIGDGEVPIRAGMFLVAPPNTRHGLANNASADLQIVFTWPTGDPVPRTMVP